MDRNVERAIEFVREQRLVIAAVASMFLRMSRAERIAKIRKLAEASPADNKFMRETFLDLYNEARSAKKAATGSHFRGAGRRGRP